MPPLVPKVQNTGCGPILGCEWFPDTGHDKKKAHFWHRVIECTAESLHWSVVPGCGNQSGVVELVGYMITCSLKLVRVDIRVTNNAVEKKEKIKTYYQ